MKKNEFIQKLDRLSEIAEEWRACHDDTFFSKYRTEITDLFSAVVLNCNSFPFNKDEIQNIEVVIKMCLLDSLGVSKFQRTSISPIEIHVIVDVFSRTNAFKSFFNFAKRYNLLLTEINSLLQIYFSIQSVVNITLISTNLDMTEEQKSEKVKALFSEKAKEINKSVIDTMKGQTLATLMNAFGTKINIDEMIELVDESCYKFIKDYVSKSKNKDESWTAFNRLLEWHLIQKISKNLFDNDNAVVCHYTNLESLYYILKNKTLRFSELKSLNDGDENNLLRYKTKNKVFTMSLSTKKDSLDLFGNYTKMDGVCIEFDNYGLTQSLNSLMMYDDETFSISLFDFGYVSYENNPQTDLFDVEIERIKTSLEKVLHAEDVEDCINGALQYLNYFYKKKPWEYESEFRIAINVPKSSLEKNIKNATLNHGSIDLFVNPKRLIKSITVGPKIKSSEYKYNSLLNMLEEFELKEIPIYKTEANYKHR